MTQSKPYLYRFCSTCIHRNREERFCGIGKRNVSSNCRFWEGPHGKLTPPRCAVFEQLLSGPKTLESLGTSGYTLDYMRHRGWVQCVPAKPRPGHPPLWHITAKGRSAYRR